MTAAIRLLVLLPLLCCCLQLHAEDDDDIAIVPLGEMAQVFDRFQPSLMRKASRWIEQYPELGARIQRHLSIIYRDTARQLDYLEPDELAHEGPQITRSLALVERNMTVIMKMHLAAQASGTERERLRAELHTELEALFDAKIAERELLVRELEQELTTIRDELDRAKAHRSAIIERKLAELDDAPDVFDW